jgi:hypothetical protein
MSSPEPLAGLAPGETERARWAAEQVGAPGTKVVAGWLVLTSSRCLFYRRAGLLGGGRPDGEPVYSVALLDLRSVVPCSFPMAIGYGDRYFLPGVELDGAAFRLGRQAVSADVVSAIDTARHSSSPPGPTTT